MHSIIHYIHWQQHIVQCSLVSVTFNSPSITSVTDKEWWAKCVEWSPPESKKAVLLQRWPHDVHYKSGLNEPLRRYGHSKLSKMAAWRQLAFDVIGNSATGSADPENPTLETNMKCIGTIGSPVAQIRLFEIFQDGGQPPSDHCAICNHSAAICDRMSPTLKSTGGGAKISLGVDPWCSLQTANIPV